MWAIIPAIVLHLFAIWCVQALGYQINFAVLGHLLVGAKEDSALEAAFLDLQEHIGDIAAYNGLLWLLAAGGGWGFRWLVITRELDQRYQVFRFSNEWYYLLTGRHWGLREGADFDVVSVDALVGTGENSVIYSGTLVGYYLSRDGGLESLWLKGVTKWVVATHVESRDAATLARMPKHRFVEVEVPGEVMVIKYTDVVNLNITFEPVDVKLASASGRVSTSGTVAATLLVGGVTSPSA